MDRGGSSSAGGMGSGSGQGSGPARSGGLGRQLDRNSDRDRVRESSDIVEVIRDHLALVPSGREFKAICPFHDDHKPSMYVVPAKQIYHCFSCGATGDVFTFVMKYLGLEFREALEMLAERAGIELTPLGRAERRDGDAVPLEQIREALALASDFYRSVLHNSDHGRAAREMIASRGISAAMVERFGLGAAPDDWERLCKALRGKGVTEAALVAAGVAKAREGGGGRSGCYDMLRNRLVFPIHGQHGKAIAFGGRKINPEDEPKYLNTPETPVFKKGKTLYGIAQAMPEIIRTGRVVVVEGYVDVIACHQYGFTNFVGTLGTALTRDHARLLRGRAREVILLFDADEAGRRAAFRAGEVFFPEPLDVRVAATPEAVGAEAKDPDELLAEAGGGEVLEAMLERSTDVLGLRFETLRDRVAGLGPAATGAAIEEELRRLVEIGINEVEPVRRRYAVHQVAGVLGLSAFEVERMLPTGRSAARRGSGSDDADGAGGDGRERYAPGDTLSVGELLLGCAIACPHAIGASDRDVLRADAYSHPLLRTVAQGVEAVLASGGAPGLDPVLRAIGDDEPAREAAIALASHVERIHKVERRNGRGDDESQARLGHAWREAVARARRERGGVASLEAKPTPAGGLVGGLPSDLPIGAAGSADAIAAAMRAKVKLKQALGRDPAALPRPYGE